MAKEESQGYNDSEQNPEIIVVVGAGVIGLQTALSLSEAGYAVAVVAKHWPGDMTIEYTSPWAGAHWRSHADPNEKKEQEFDRVTFEHWMALIEKGEENTGLGIFSATFYEDADEQQQTHLRSPLDLWWKDLVPGFEILPTTSLPLGVRIGSRYKSICLNPDKYLPYLLEKLSRNYGIKTIKHELQHSLFEIFGIPSLRTLNIIGIVNCTGLGARHLVPDPDVYPIRGHTVLVKNQAQCAIFREGKDGEVTYIIPRPGGGTILGGTKEVGVWSGEVDRDILVGIVKRCGELMPDLLGDGLEIIHERVGLRPARKGGVRIEVEWVDGVQEKRFFVCHEYGHAGAGYQNSVGSARETVKLIVQALETNKEKRKEQQDE